MADTDTTDTDTATSSTPPTSTPHAPADTSAPLVSARALAAGFTALRIISGLALLTNDTPPRNRHQRGYICTLCVPVDGWARSRKEV